MYRLKALVARLKPHLPTILAWWKTRKNRTR
ncbi:hypothetical protein SEA_WOFFORD_186 [Streptomyces phage Wofford]|uniref:Uncharacterized protein n=1 Tax=Streptomyces phage Wofford TaxID=2283267 RepID=A0A345MA09_9CAUD|nr:hypothetical protein HWB78_gp125 [Streptomyces phage Wollford]AXH67330.1 hypothetical protein SEA_WOFFORD_186 [Streptomyces phage Wollford]